MKLKFTYFLFAIGLISIALSYGSSGGRAAAANSGNTGAPGDNTETCVTCHGNSAAIQVLIDLDLLDGAGEPITEYTPGATYTAKILLDVQQGTPEAFGFQMVALKGELDQNGEDAAAYGAVSANAQVVTTTGANPRTYVEHDGPSETNEFTAEWTAPEAGTGPISFYACGNGVNDNGTTGGDNAACIKVQFNEAIDTRTNTLEAISALNVYPNPVSDNLMLEVAATEHQSGKWSLNSLSGRMLTHQALELNTGNNLINIPVNHLSSGIYFLKIQTEEGFITKRIIKQ